MDETIEDRIYNLWTINDIMRNDDGEIMQIYFSDDIYDIVACLTYPRDEEGYLLAYLLRAEFQRDFDRWSNCSYENTFTFVDEDKLKELLFPTKIYDILSVNSEVHLMSEIEDDYIG